MKVSNEMVQRFLGWRLPDDFYPDGGVTFNREVNGGLRPKTWWPVGTNLLTDPQARAMLEHVVGPEFDALLARCEAVEARLAEAHDLLALAAGVAEVKRILATGLSHAGQRNHIALLLEAAETAEVAPKPGVCRHCGQYLDRRGKCRNPEHNS